MPRPCEWARPVAAAGQSTEVPLTDALVASEEGFEVGYSYVQAKMMGLGSL